MVLFATLGPSSGLGIILVALALSGLGMGIALPATSSTMANEVAASEYGVMSAAQLMATQVGEVAGIQVVLTLQESWPATPGWRTCITARRSCTASRSPSGWPPSWPAPGVLCACFMRPLAAMRAANRRPVGRGRPAAAVAAARRRDRAGLAR